MHDESVFLSRLVACMCGHIKCLSYKLWLQPIGNVLINDGLPVERKGVVRLSFLSVPAD